MEVEQVQFLEDEKAVLAEEAAAAKSSVQSGGGNRSLTRADGPQQDLESLR
jgi:hypothetical protein